MLILLALGSPACRGPDGYPSLQPRPIEDLSLAEPATPAPRPVIENTQATARYVPAIDQARRADELFRKSLAEERGAIARGHGVLAGSDGWTEAQQALSRVEVTRGPVATALADLDAARDAERTHSDSGELAAATQAYETVREIDAAEVKALADAQAGKPLR